MERELWNPNKKMIPRLAALEEDCRANPRSVMDARALYLEQSQGIFLQDRRHRYHLRFKPLLLARQALAIITQNPFG